MFCICFMYYNRYFGNTVLVIGSEAHLNRMYRQSDIYRYIYRQRGTDKCIDRER